MRLFSIYFFLAFFIFLKVSANCEQVLNLDQLIVKYRAEPYQVLEGSGWGHIFKGKFKRQPVFIKVMNPQTRSLSDYQNEARVFLRLKATSYGHTLLASERLDDQRLALILKFYPLVVTLPTSLVNHQQAIFLKKNAEPIINQVDYILADLQRKKLVPLDFQIGVTQAGQVVLIDVEAYRDWSHGDQILYHFAKQKILNFLSPYRSGAGEINFNNIGQIGLLGINNFKD